MRIIKGNNRLYPFAKNKALVVPFFLILSLFLVTAAATSATAGPVIDQYPFTKADDSHVINEESPGWGQSFMGNGGSISQVWFYLKRTGSPTGFVVARIYSHSGTYGSSSIPGELLATSDPVDASTIPSVAYNQIYFNFASPYTTTNATHYVVTCEWRGGNSSNLLEIAFDSSSPSHPGNVCYLGYDGWKSIDNQDLCFGVLTAGSSATPAPDPTPTPEPTSTPEPPPLPIEGSTVNAYGAPWRWFSLDNLNVGTAPDCHGLYISYRFRADHTGEVDAGRFYLQVTEARYAAGNAGVIRCELQTDDGTANHFPSGQVLAYFQVDNPQVTSAGRNGLFNRFAFNTQPVINAGQLYHLVFTNASPDPKNNWYGINNICNGPPRSPMQAAVSDTDYAVLRKISQGSPWLFDDRVKSDTPLFTLYYTDGYSLGQAYMQIYSDNPWKIQGNIQVRETFTVSGGDKTVNNMCVALWKTTGTVPGSLTLRLEQGDGTLIEQGTIPASSVPTGDRTAIDWVTYRFNTPRMLTNGSTYNLVVSAPAGDAYNLLPMMKGSAYGFSGWEFKDGWIEKNTGSGWTSNFPDFGWNGPHFDMMFYFY